MKKEKKKYSEKDVTLSSASKKRKKGIKILFAEDEIINQNIVKSILDRLGYRLDTVSNGRDALKALEQESYDLVIMDCQMPEMDGYETAQEIRNPDSKVLDHKVPVVAFTGHTMDDDKERCINAGMDDFLTKPVKPLDLSVMVEKWILKRLPVKTEPSTVQEADTGEDIFDLSVLMENLSGDMALIHGILNDFLKYIPGKTSALKKACKNGDSPAVRHEAHTIKGSSANIGAMSLKKIAHQIEIAGQNGDLMGVDLLLAQYDEQLDLLKNAINFIRVKT